MCVCLYTSVMEFQNLLNFLEKLLLWKYFFVMTWQKSQLDRVYANLSYFPIYQLVIDSLQEKVFTS